jgi:hypothetical protein
MKISINGVLCKLNLLKFIKAPMKDKISILRIIYKDKKERFINYWFGYVEVKTQGIMVVDFDKETKNPLYEVSIVVGMHGRGQWFSHIDLDTIKQILEKTEGFNGKYFHLTIDLGSGMSQDYLFTKRQIKMLIPKLEELLDKEWYEDDECE